ncbi:MAG TPA: hypothetical protein VI320_09335 [Terracidiphilus sp.]|jgi:hypothetical protein
MASQTLNQFKGEARTSFLLRDILPGSGWALSRAPAGSFPRIVERAPAENAEEANCIRGFLAAIAIEGLAGLGVFGLWQGWHLMIR